jgi:hypothetical protein
MSEVGEKVNMPPLRRTGGVPSRQEGWADSKEFLCGWGAASINVVLTFPLNKMIFRQQLYGIRPRVAIQQLQREGLMHLYRGLLPPFVQKTTSMSLMFGTYDAYRRRLVRGVPQTPVLLGKAVAAMLAGCTEAILSPLERVQTLMQDKSYHNHWRNTAVAFRDIHAEYGIREFYRGLTPILLRNGPSNAMFFIGRDEVKCRLPKPHTMGGGIATDFVSGAVLGAVISTVFYPLNVVKSHMQWRLGGRYVGVVAALRAVYEQRGRSWRRLYLGAGWNFNRSLISWGIINAAYELLKNVVFPDSDDDS